MDRLFAPWRLPYLRGETGTQLEVNEGESLFATILAQDRDHEFGVLWRGERAFVILNAYPYASGHLMVMPMRAVGDMDDLTWDELAEINWLVRACTGWLRKAYGPQGFNIGINMGAASGAGLPNHIHWHVVPRWSGDTNFMTTVGQVRVLPEDLADTYQRLKRIVEENPVSCPSSERT